MTLKCGEEQRNIIETQLSILESTFEQNPRYLEKIQELLSKNGTILNLRDHGTPLKFVEEAQEHAELTFHSNFSQSTEAILNLVCASGGNSCRSRIKNDLHTKRPKHIESVDITDHFKEMTVPEVDKKLHDELEAPDFPTSQSTCVLHFFEITEPKQELMYKSLKWSRHSFMLNMYFLEATEGSRTRIKFCFKYISILPSIFEFTCKRSGVVKRFKANYGSISNVSEIYHIELFARQVLTSVVYWSYKDGQGVQRLFNNKVAVDISLVVDKGPKVVYVIKVQRNLNEVYFGGIVSCALLPMIIAMLQNLCNSQALILHYLRMLLVHFFKFCGRNLNTEIINLCISILGDKNRVQQGIVTTEEEIGELGVARSIEENRTEELTRYLSAK
ncbi:hypothetical protein GQ457_02G029620 [Hibiscus cannabinus]